jgi:hypothetical protein
MLILADYRPHQAEINTPAPSACPNFAFRTGTMYLYLNTFVRQQVASSSTTKID